MALDAGKAYYAAESGIEIGLLDVKEHAPGWEPGSEISEDVADGQNFELTLKNKASSYPYLDSTKYDLESAESEAFYDVLELNESVTVPLFTVDESGKEVPVHDFVVYYYVNFGPDDLKFSDTAVLSGWDILRWKIYGLTETQPVITESINDFTAVSVIEKLGGDTEITNAASPTWIGSVDCNTVKGLNGGKIQCLPYSSDTGEVNEEYGFEIYDYTCSQTEAREYYGYLNGKVKDVYPCYPIRTFLTEHSYNYLTLTNLMNKAVFKAYGDKQKLEKSKLYYRIEAYDGDLPLEYADIDSVGISGGSKVKLNALKKRGGQLPVFNFALYHTAE
jgi:hypothetical protein